MGIAPFHSTSVIKRSLPYCRTAESLHCLSQTLYDMKAEVAFYVPGVEKRSNETGTMQNEPCRNDKPHDCHRTVTRNEEKLVKFLTCI
jgi:hypothetical protein